MACLSLVIWMQQKTAGCERLRCMPGALSTKTSSTISCCVWSTLLPGGGGAEERGGMTPSFRNYYNSILPQLYFIRTKLSQRACKVTGPILNLAHKRLLVHGWRCLFLLKVDRYRCRTMYLQNASLQLQTTSFLMLLFQRNILRLMCFSKIPLKSLSSSCWKRWNTAEGIFTAVKEINIMVI